MNSAELKGIPPQDDAFLKLIKTQDCDGNCLAGLFCSHYIKYLQKDKCYEGFADAIRTIDLFINSPKTP